MKETNSQPVFKDWIDAAVTILLFVFIAVIAVAMFYAVLQLPEELQGQHLDLVEEVLGF